MRYSPLAFLLLLGACTAAQTATVNTTVSKSLATAQADLAKATLFVQTAEGIANVAALAQPKLAAPIATAEAALNPLMADAQVALTAATADAPTLEDMAATLVSQAATLTQTAAPAIKVISAATK